MVKEFHGTLKYTINGTEHEFRCRYGIFMEEFDNHEEISQYVIEKMKEHVKNRPHSGRIVFGTAMVLEGKAV